MELAPYATTLFAAEGYRTSGNVQFMRPEGRNVRVIGRFVDLPEGLRAAARSRGDSAAVEGLATIIVPIY